MKAIKYRGIVLALLTMMFAGTFLVSCSQGNREVGASLDRIEQVVQQHPDSALAELVRLDSLLDTGTLRIEGARQMARYALLKTQTHDKNYIDDTNDSLILQAVRYYDDHGSKQEQMLAHFYHGAIFRNAKDYGAAFFAYRQAENYAQELDDDYYLTRIYGNLFSLSHDTYSQDAIMYARKNMEYARKSGDVREAFQAKADMGRTYSTRLQYDSAEYWFRQVIDSLPASDPILQYCLTSYIEQCVNNRKIHLADSLLNLLSPIVQPVDFLNKACLYQIKGVADSADVFVQRAKQSIKTPNQQVFYYEKLSWIAEMRGDYATALSFKKQRLYNQNEIVTGIYSKSVSNYQRDFERIQKELVQIRYEAYRLQSILVVVCILLLFVLLCAYLYKLIKAQNRDLEKAIKNNFKQSVLLGLKDETLVEQRMQIEQLEQLLQEARGVSIVSRLSRLLARHFNLYNKLGYNLYKTQMMPRQHRTIYEFVDVEIKRLCCDKKIITEIDRIIDESFDDAMTKAKTKEMGLKEDDIRLVRFMLMHLSSRTIAYLLEIDPIAVYKRKSRLKDKLTSVETPYSREILALLDFLKRDDDELQEDDDEYRNSVEM